MHKWSWSGHHECGKNCRVSNRLGSPPSSTIGSNWPQVTPNLPTPYINQILVLNHIGRIGLLQAMLRILPWRPWKRWIVSHILAGTACGDLLRFNRWRAIKCLYKQKFWSKIPRKTRNRMEQMPTEMCGRSSQNKSGCLECEWNWSKVSCSSDKALQ